MARQLQDGLAALGYDVESAALHRASPRLQMRHAYAPELHDLLNPQGEIRAEAVLDVEGTPTVAFFANGQPLLSNPEALRAIRKRIWNQGLVSVLLVFTDDAVVPVPVSPRGDRGEQLSWKDARPDGPFSLADVHSGQIRERHADWFRVEDRVDRKLLTNLRRTVEELSGVAVGQRRRLGQDDAQYLMAQVLFISYLEHRGIVGDQYRQKHNVRPLYPAIASADRKAVERLLSQLKRDFNGDFLDKEAGTASLWRDLPDLGFQSISDFLSAADKEKFQPSFFPYDFRYIPVEMLSGVYESFIGRDAKTEFAAYYTPRHLANLVVDQALSCSSDLLAERIFDGACGSGILLTTAFRRLLGEAEARRPTGQLPLRDRIKLLIDHIFGSDVSEAACRVTAFSLYLSLLERLEPSDIAALCDDENLKLPKLRGTNLVGGESHGDFFDPNNPLGGRRDFTLLISNPPWKELANGQSFLQLWKETSKPPAVLNQLAAYFAWRASEIAGPGARLCLILPMSLMLKPTSQAFLAGWFERVRPIRLINFGDLKELLFEDARLSCVVVLAEVRQERDKTGIIISGRETFEYWAPKADVSLAFARLTLHGVDRHDVQTQAIAGSNRELVTRMWGDTFDLALWARLRLRGTFESMFTGKRARWARRKGFHRADSAIPVEQWVSTQPLWRSPFVDPRLLHDHVVLEADGVQPFPRKDMPTVPRLSEELLEVFEGPRILFPDGPSPDGSIRATFTNMPASFMSSVGVIRGPDADEDLLRFAAAYLRSDLVRYFMATQLYQRLGDRDRVSLSDLAEFPFYPPENHRDPKAATRIVHKVAELTRASERHSLFERLAFWDGVKDEVDGLIQSYFDVSPRDQAIVLETVQSVLPTIRPYGFESVFKNAARRIGASDARAYASTLVEELNAWRDAREGTGSFAVEVLLTSLERAGPFGLVRISVNDPKQRSREGVQKSDDAVAAVVSQLRKAALLPLMFSETVYFAADTVIRDRNTVYLVKPQAPRFWLRRQARRDARRIVDATTQAG